MSFAQPWRRSRLAAAAVSASALTAALLAAIPPTTAQAAVSGTVTVTVPANGKLAADTPKQVVVLTVTGTGATALTEDNVVGVKLGDDADCDDLTGYVVTSATTITVKTPAGGCEAGVEEVAILFTGSESLMKAAGITFVAPPGIVAVGSKPVINDNSAMLASADQSRRFSTAGNQVVRVKAASDFTFLPGTAAGLAASLGGKPGTEVKVYATDVSTTPITSGTPDPGNSMSFKTAALMSGDTLVLTQNGVSKSFLAAAHLATVTAVPIVTSLSVNSVRAGGTVSTVITGSKWAATLSEMQDASKWTVNFCDKAATVTALTATAVTVTTPVITDDADGLGADVFAGSCPVTIKDETNDVTSPITGGSVFTAMSE